jgi:L-lysine 2,3-aminomutase
MEYTDTLNHIRELLDSDALEERFEHAAEEQRYEILDFLETLMDLGEKADAVATRLIFKNSYLESLAGVKSQE